MTYVLWLMQQCGEYYQRDISADHIICLADKMLTDGQFEHVIRAWYSN